MGPFVQTLDCSCNSVRLLDLRYIARARPKLHEKPFQWPGGMTRMGILDHRHTKRSVGRHL